MEELFNGDEIRCRKFENKIKKALTTIDREAREEEREHAFSVLMESMPKSAENIATIIPIDARVTLQDFVKNYWTNPLSH